MINIARIVPIVFLLSACNANFQIPSVHYADDDYVIGRAGWIFGVDCPGRKMNGTERCPERYAPKPRTMNEIKKLARQIDGAAPVMPAGSMPNGKGGQEAGSGGAGDDEIDIVVDSELRNSIQTLLMMHADEVCSNYQYRLLGTVVGARIGANALDQAVGLLASVVTGSVAGEFLSQVRGAFSSSTGFLDDDFLKASFFLGKFEEVQHRKRVMRSIIMVAQSFSLKASDSRSPNINVGYSIMEAVSDAAAYHRVCDLGYMLSAGDELDEAEKQLFAWRFTSEFKRLVDENAMPPS